MSLAFWSDACFNALNTPPRTRLTILYTTCGLTVALFCLSAAASAYMHVRWQRLHKNKSFVWRLYGWFTALSCAGSVFGCAPLPSGSGGRSSNGVKPRGERPTATGAGSGLGASARVRLGDASLAASLGEAGASLGVAPLPEPRSAYKVFRAIGTRWEDNDVYGHVNNVVYYGFFDTAVNNYLIQQGGLDERLRAESATALRAIGFDGYAIGGLAVGEGQPAMFGVLDYATGQLPEDAPRYLMGVGKPDDIVGAVVRGVDMFDCVLPTRSGRNGQAFTHDGPLNLRNAVHGEDLSPLDADCRCPVCHGPEAASRAYLHHLIKAGEMLGAMLLTQHNIGFYQQLMASLRAAISEQLLNGFAAAFLARYHAKRR
jgi:hypothetical protein